MKNRSRKDRLRELQINCYLHIKGIPALTEMESCVQLDEILEGLILQGVDRRKSLEVRIGVEY